jgi:hypothetical protein
MPVVLFSLSVTALLWLALGSERAEILGTTYERSAFHHLLVFQDYYAAPLVLGILVAGLFPPLQRAGLAVAAWCSRHILAVAAGTAAALALGSVLVYHAHPLSMDEFAPYFQSRVFAAGRLTGEFPPDLVRWLIPPGFRDVFFKVDVSGHVVSSYWPGFALLLTPFTAAGAPWLLNPLIGGATVLVMHKLGRELFAKPEWAGLVALLTLASPAVSINAISFYSMPAHLLLNATYALLLLKPSPGRAFLAGLIGSVALVLHNPVPHMAFALPWIAWLALREGRLRVLGCLAAGYLPLCVFLGFGWAWYYRSLGSARTVLEVAVQAGPAKMAWQSMSNVFALPYHTLLVDRLWGLGKLWLWAAPALITFGALGLNRVRGAVWRVFAGSALLTLFVYVFVPWDQGHGWGFRYFHSAWLVLPLFAVAALAESGERQGAPSGSHRYLAACALLSLVAMNALRAFQVEGFVARHLAQVPVAESGDTRITIIEPLGGFKLEDLVQNDPLLRNPAMRLASRGPAADAAMMAQRFPQFRLLHMDKRGSVWGIPAEERAK